MWSLRLHPNCYKKIFLSFLPSTRMSGKNIKFGEKVIKKSDFYVNKKVTKIDDTDVNKILISKEEPYGQKILSNTFLDTIMMTLSNHYA